MSNEITANETETTEAGSSQSAAALALTITDRCDACGAQAYVRVTLTTGELLFCAHHANANKEKLQPIAISWQDETEKLLAR